jgi:type IV pilus assembly protein PilC
MPFFKYQAKNSAGEVYEKKVEAKERLDLYRIIREEGGTVVSISEVKNAAYKNIFSERVKGIKTHDKIILAKNLGAMIKAGLSVTRAFSVMEKQARTKSLKKLFQDLASDVSHGETLSDAMKKKQKIFSPLFISMVRAGEESGNLAGSLDVVSTQMEKSYMLTKKVKGALIYPAVILCVMVVILILMLIYMVPTLTSTFEGIGVELPLSTRIIIGMSNFVVHHTLIVIGGIVMTIGGVLAFGRSAVGRKLFDKLSIKIPIIGPIVKEVQSARTARTLSSLLSSGVDIVVALDVSIDVLQNHLYKEALTKAKSAIQKGDPMSTVFMEYEHLYPAFVGEMVGVGEETGKISEMLLSTAVFYEDEVDQKTKDLSTIIEPLLMVVIGAGVGIFAISMLAPTYSLVDSF